MPNMQNDRASKTTQKFAVRVGDRPTIADRLLDVIANIPASREQPSDDPETRARHLTRIAAAKSGATAGVLALPPGVFGWATITPELYAVWKIQAQLVADIAGVYGKTHQLGREQMLYSLFGHTAAGAFQDLVVRVGERYLIRRTPVSGLYAVGNKIAMLIAQRSAGRLVTRWLPAIGALGVAGFVYVDTGKVAETAIELFESDMIVENAIDVTPAPEAPKRKRLAVTKATRKPRGAVAKDAPAAPRKAAVRKRAPRVEPNA